MSKLRIGVVVYRETHPSEGGGHAYYEALLDGINEYNFNEQIEIVNIVLYSGKKPSINFRNPVIYIRLGFGMRFKSAVKKTIAPKADKGEKSKNYFYQFLAKAIRSVHNRNVIKILSANKIELLYYLKPERNVFEYPFIATNWDVAHRSTYGFPEISMKGIFKDREEYFQYTLSKAFLVFCESVTGAKELKQYYPMCSEKVRVMPIFASNVIRLKVRAEEQRIILNKYNLQKDKFFIYPAQLWPLKNHYNLLMAFKQFVTELQDTEMKMVFSGSDKGNRAYIVETIDQLKLQEQVVLTGFVPQEEVYTFYKNSIALTMPTYLGPTNLPLLEAAHLECPVICSDLDGHRELLEDSALYVNPSDVHSIKHALKQMMEPSTRQHCANLAKHRVLHSPFRLEESLARLNDLLLEILPIRKAWGIEYRVKV